MVLAPPITVQSLRKQLKTKSEVRVPATPDDYFNLLDEEDEDIYFDLFRNHLTARLNVNTENHELVTANVIGLLFQQTTGKPDFRVMGSNRPVYVAECELGFAPDVLVIKGPTELFPRHRAMPATLNPWLLVEVLSKSNRGEEFARKLACFKKIPSLEHILQIEPDYYWASLFSRTPTANQWLNTDSFDGNDTVRLGDFTMPMSEIYRSVVFAK